MTSSSSRVPTRAVKLTRLAQRAFAMNSDFLPKHSQPFSIAQARQLDVSTITAEISRLENSLDYLGRTQSELKEALTDGHDQDLADALRENEVVMYASL